MVNKAYQTKKFEQTVEREQSLMDYRRGVKAAQLCYDLIELKTGDMATFLFSKSEQDSKELTEHAALEQLLMELPPHTSHLLARYETQAEPEARFVRYVDKLLPLVIDTIGCGERVMREDYSVTSIEALRHCHALLHERIVAKFGNEFPELDLAHALLCELFEISYENRMR